MHARPPSKRFIEALGAALPEGIDPDELCRLLDRISLVPYNEGTTIGHLALCRDRGAPLVRLDEPMPIDNARGVRKLLQMTSSTLVALCDGRVVHGLGDPSPDLLLVRFQWPGLWRLGKGGKTLLRTKMPADGEACDQLREDVFHGALGLVFGRLPLARQSHLWNLMLSATRQQGGTNVLISANAAAEARRLADQCTTVKPFVLTVPIMQQITAIDGTAVIDLDGQCHAVGAILDGASSPRGDRTRGGRYNSAVMYVDSSPFPSLILVVSKDGMIDLVFRQPGRSPG
jgi:hypothetical protein